MNAISTEQAERNAMLFAKFAALEPHKRKTALRAMECLACERIKTCEVGRAFCFELRTFPNCP